MTTNTDNGKSSTVIKRDRDFPFTGQSIPCSIEYPNKTLEDIIELTGVHGKGGMGVVYKAISQKRKKQLAVKILEITEEVENFEKEAETAKKCSKKKGINIVPTLSYGRQILKTSIGPKEVAYIVMPYIEHRNLSEERLQINEVDEIALQLARTIEGLHEEGIVHRDINPKNIFVEKNGKTWLADLGLAKDTEDKIADETAAETIKGTPCYMSPQQAKGENVNHKREEKELFGKTDVYSFGSTMYKLATGKTPFPAANATLTIKAVQDVKNPLDARKIDGNVPVTLNDIIGECTYADDPKKRPTMKEVKHEFEMRIESKKYNTKEERDKVLKDTEIGPKWYDWLIPAPLPGVIAVYKFLKGKNKNIEKLLRTHELASWITDGRTRRFHQKQVLNYYKQLNIMANKDEVPADVDVIASIAERQLRKGPDPEIERQKIRGIGLKEKWQAQKCLDKIIDAGNVWLRGDIEDADELRKDIEEEFKKVKKMRWREQVKPTYDQFNLMLDGSIKIQKAKKLLDRCNDYIDQRKIGMAKKDYDDAIILLNEVPRNPVNPHFDSADSKAKEKRKLLDEEGKLFRIKECIDSMKGYAESEDYDNAHIFSKEIGDLIDETPISDRRRELKHEWREE
ncbi:serine/threonine protein kinase, partial [Candidatus Woesearchaeota archaeon]|nr:serine/threonine protein kinase [Candidatus Woesearchaeota archaeon]